MNLLYNAKSLKSIGITYRAATNRSTTTHRRFLAAEKLKFQSRKVGRADDSRDDGYKVKSANKLKMPLSGTG